MREFSKQSKSIADNLYMARGQTDMMDASGLRGKRAPLGILDVDGVILPHQSHVGDKGDYQQIRVKGMGNFVIHPDTIKLLKEAEQRAQMIWCTRWQQASQDLLAPALELGLWDSLELGSRFGQVKWEQVLKLDTDPTRPLFWVDDNEIPDFVTSWAEKRVGPTLIIRPQGAVGLSDQDRAKIREFLHTHGQDQPLLPRAIYKHRKSHSKPRFT